MGLILGVVISQIVHLDRSTSLVESGQSGQVDRFLDCMLVTEWFVRGEMGKGLLGFLLLCRVEIVLLRQSERVLGTQLQILVGFVHRC